MEDTIPNSNNSRMTRYFTFEVDSNTTIERVKAGLESALYKRGLSVPDGESSGFRSANIKLQKLTYMVVEHFDIPVIRTWYRYGQFEPYGTLRPKYVTPQTLDEPEMPVPSGEYDNLSQQDIEGYFLELGDLEEEWNRPLIDFLRANYENEAGDDYREIYLANLEILEVLGKIETDQELPSRAAEYAERLEPAAIDLWYEMKEAPYFSKGEVNVVRDFVDDLQMGLITLAAEEDPEGPQVNVIKDARDLYHNKIWPWPTMQISINEAKGPEKELKDDFLPEGREYLSLWEETFPDAFNNWQKELYKVDLVGKPVEYQSIKHETPEAVGKLEQASLYSASDVEE